MYHVLYVFLFFFNDTATTEIYTLSLHDALPISGRRTTSRAWGAGRSCSPATTDRKSTRLNSSHGSISYAVFCLKNKNTPYTSRHGSISSADFVADPEPSHIA